MKDDSRKEEKVPPMTNMDPSFNIPGSITPEERAQMDYAQVTNKELDEVPQVAPKKRGPSKPKTLPPLQDPSIPNDPLNGMEPIRKGGNEEFNMADLAPPKPKVESKPVEPTKIEVPEEFDQNPKTPVPEEEPLPKIVTDHVGEEPLEDEIDVEPSKPDATVTNGVTSEESHKEEKPVVSYDVPKDEPENEPKGEPVSTTDTSEPSEPAKDAFITASAENALVGGEIEVESAPKKVKEETMSADDEEQLKKNAEGSFPETAYVEGITEEAATDEYIKSHEALEKTVPVRQSPKTLSSEELTEIVDYTTRHYRIFEGQKQTLRKPIDLSDQSKIQVVEFREDSNFDVAKLRIDREAKQGVRKVQVVCTQSGYSVCCLPMNSRELQSYGRDERSKVENTYGTNMSIAEAIYRKLTDFSCGAMSFEKWMEVTALPDLETMIFGVYLATYPGYNNFNLSCTYTNCQKEFVIPIKSDTLIQLAPGNVTQEQIQEVLFSGKNPAELIKASKRYTGIRIFTENKTKMFIVRTPSIGEFYDRAYRGKRENVIQAYAEDMYFSGYIRSVGTLDIEKYNESGEIVYYNDDRIEAIDKAIADLSADDKEIFNRRMLDYINRYSVSYQIPRVRCPHCRRIMSQREVSPRSLFFAAKIQRGL